MLAAAVQVANKKGLLAVTFDSVAEACTVSTSRHTVKHYFKTIPALYSEVVAHKDCDADVAENGRALGY
jgi:AcrR family transcriptional regulator